MVHSDATWFPFECKQNALDWDFKIDSQIPPAPFFFLSPQFITCSMIAISHVWLWTELEVNTHWFPHADTLKQQGDKTTPADLQSKGRPTDSKSANKKQKSVIWIMLLPSSGSENLGNSNMSLLQFN